MYIKIESLNTMFPLPKSNIVDT